MIFHYYNNQERLEPIFKLQAVQNGKIVNRNTIGHSGEYKCFKNFFFHMKIGDSVVIRNLYSGYRECIFYLNVTLHSFDRLLYTIGTITSDIQWASGEGTE